MKTKPQIKNQNQNQTKRRSQLNVCITFYNEDGSLVSVETFFIKSNMTLGTVDLFARRRAEEKRAMMYNISFAWFRGNDDENR